jgi:hypothetical protein
MIPDRSDIIWGACLSLILIVGCLAFLPLPAPGLLATNTTTPPIVEGDFTGDWVDALDRRMSRADEIVPVATGQVSSLGRYQLIGLVESEGDNWALISDGQSSLTLTVGAILDGFELVRVESERAVFVSDGDEVVLNLAQ